MASMLLYSSSSQSFPIIPIKTEDVLERRQTPPRTGNQIRKVTVPLFNEAFVSHKEGWRTTSATLLPPNHATFQKRQKMDWEASAVVTVVCSPPKNPKDHLPHMLTSYFRNLAIDGKDEDWKLFNSSDPGDFVHSILNVLKPVRNAGNDHGQTLHRIPA